ncbi:MAG TPA: DUF2934 domain-containing protein [Myxococcaceae bacterium]|nr:DUF2934 domain-containing protein [Myxococcaceae bacterium]
MSRQKPQNHTTRRTQPVTTTDERSQVVTSITNEQIAARAYEIYLARGGENGHDVEDWYQAERELKLGRQ